MIPAHHARAIHSELPTVPEYNNARMASTIDVTGWFSANTRIAVGIVSVGTNAELMNGKKMRGYANALAPSIVFALRPGITASQVSANIKSRRIPITASHSKILALERKPIMRAIRIIMATEIAFETIEVSTCPHRIADRLIGIELNLVMIPFCISVNKRKAVYEIPEAIAMSKIPGSK